MNLSASNLKYEVLSKGAFDGTSKNLYLVRGAYNSFFLETMPSGIIFSLYS
jgi:hypothetical protein